MSRRITIERAKELDLRMQERKNVSLEKNTSILGRYDKKRFQRENKKKRWEKEMKERGGLVPRKAKYWGDDCDIKQCKKWVDGSCQYSERDNGKCMMDGVKNAD